MASPPPFRRRITSTIVVGNLIGALIAFFYFQFIDPAAAEVPRVGVVEIAFSVVAFALLAFAGSVLGRRWGRPLAAWVGPEGLPESAVETARRRALLLPYVFTAHTFLGWILAGLVWGVLWELLAGTFSVYQSIRQVFGITIIGGGMTAAFTFFAIEHYWRRQLPRFFPDGDLSAVRGALRFPVRVRLLAIFVMTSVIPLMLLGVLSYTRALGLLGADPSAAAQIVESMRLIILFILAVGVAAAVGLSIFAANSVAGPLRRLS